MVQLYIVGIDNTSASIVCLLTNSGPYTVAENSIATKDWWPCTVDHTHCGQQSYQEVWRGTCNSDSKLQLHYCHWNTVNYHDVIIQTSKLKN